MRSSGRDKVHAHSINGARPWVGATGVVLMKVFDLAALGTLRKSGKVLWLAHGVKNTRTAGTGFVSVYWSADWWGSALVAGHRLRPETPGPARVPELCWFNGNGTNGVARLSREWEQEL